MSKFPLLPFTSDVVLDCCEKGLLKEEEIGLNTVFICSYPKSGTTWTQNIVYQLLNQQHKNSHNTSNNTSPSLGVDIKHISEVAPFYEAPSTWDFATKTVNAKHSLIQQRLQYRVFNTHLQFNMLPTTTKPADATATTATTSSGEVKYIYLYRNGKDVITSFYHHLHNEKLNATPSSSSSTTNSEEGQKEDEDDGFNNKSFKELLSMWLNGDLPYGRWLNHIQDFEQAYNKDNNSSNNNSNKSKILMLRYEDMLTSLEESVRKIRDFLSLVVVTDEDVKAISQQVSFQNMKRDIQLFQPISVQWKEGFSFIRQGVANSYQQQFDAEDEERYHQHISPQQEQELFTRLLTSQQQQQQKQLQK